MLRLAALFLSDRLPHSQSTIFRAGGELKNQPSSDPDAAKLAVEVATN